MRHRATAVIAAALVALGASACDPNRTVVNVPEQDVGEADTTPFVEPESPPADDLERPDDDDGLD